jgi:hypothetical protein
MISVYIRVLRLESVQTRLGIYSVYSFSAGRCSKARTQSSGFLKYKVAGKEGVPDKGSTSVLSQGIGVTGKRSNRA